MWCKLRDKRYSIRLGPCGGDWGEIDDAKREIKINPAAKGKKLLYALIHEGLHGCLPDLSEGAINETAESLTEILWKSG